MTCGVPKASGWCRPRLAALALVAAVTLCATETIAQPRAGAPAESAAPGSVAPSANAAHLAREGEAAAAKGDLEGAREKLARAFQVQPAYDIAGNLGGVELGLGRYRDAAEHLAFSLSKYPTTGNPKQRELTESFLVQAHERTLPCQLCPDFFAAGDSPNELMCGGPPLEHHSKLRGCRAHVKVDARFRDILQRWFPR